MNWKISKIEVSSFKAFKHIYLDLDESALLTLDGPNGYGKTSIFDAIELLLTGQISRIQNLFSTLLRKVRTSIPRTKNENFSHLISMGYH